MGRPKSGLSLLTEEEIIERCKVLYELEGPAALTFESLKKHKLYYQLYGRRITQEALLKRLGVKDAYETYRLTVPVNRSGGMVERWTWERVVSVATEVRRNEGYLPPAGWFTANGPRSLVKAVYGLGRTWADLRVEIGDFKNSTFVESRNGQRWLSHPEASLSNFLYARGIEHRRGERYPPEFAEKAAQARGFFDLHFKANDDRWIDVEIWGDNPGGHGRDVYQARRSDKEAFNSANPNFLGIGFQDCFADGRLTDLLMPYIGTIEPFRFDRPTDRFIQSTHWSNSDELLDFCRDLASQMPDGAFPTEGWLRKRGCWVNRPGPLYNTASIYIKRWLGGVRAVRELLGQAHASTMAWDRAKVLAAWKAFVDAHQMTPSQYRSRARRKKLEWDDAIFREAARLDAAAVKFVGGTAEANQAIGYTTTATRKWTREKVYTAYRDLITRWNATPSHVLNNHRTGKSLLAEDERRHLQQLIDVSNREFGGSKLILRELGFETPSRSQKKRP